MPILPVRKIVTALYKIEPSDSKGFRLKSPVIGLFFVFGVIVL